MVLLNPLEIFIALQISRHLSNTRLSCMSNLSLQLELFMPKTTMSLISETFNSPEFQVLASILRSVTYLSNVSPEA